MTAEATVPQNSLKAQLAWSAIAVVLAGYFWSLLDQHALTLLGLGAFLLATVVLVFGLRATGTAGKAVPIAVVVALVAASAAVLILL